MSSRIDGENVLRQQLLELLRGGHAHQSFEDIIAGFPLEKINEKPPKMPYTIWQLLEHIRIAQDDILRFILDPDYTSPEWPTGYWPDRQVQADEQMWQRSIAQYQNDHRQLIELVANPETDLTAPIPHAKDYNILREILVVSDHNAYHIGELGILRHSLTR